MNKKTLTLDIPCLVTSIRFLNTLGESTDIYDINTGKKIPVIFSSLNLPFILNHQYLLFREPIKYDKLQTILFDIENNEPIFPKDFKTLPFKKILGFDYLPKPVRIDDTNRNDLYRDVKYLIIILEDRVEIYNSKFEFIREIYKVRECEVLTYGVNLLVLCNRHEILIYSIIGGELVKKLNPNIYVDITRTFVLPNGKLASYFDEQDNNNTLLVEWNIYPHFPTVKGDGKWLLIDKGYLETYIRKVLIRNSILLLQENDEYFIISSNVDTPMIYDSSNRKLTELREYVGIEEQKGEKIRDVFAMYDSIVMLRYDNYSLIYDIATKTIIKKLQYKIYQLYIVGDTFIAKYIPDEGKMSPVKNSLIRIPGKADGLIGINKKGDIIRIFPFFIDIHSIIPFSKKRKEKVNETIDILLKYVGKNMTNIIRRFIIH